MVFFIVPFAIVVYYSLISNPVTKEFVGLENYTKLFSNVAFKRAAQNSIFFSVTAVPLSVVLSLGLAVILERNIPGKSILRTFFLSPLMVPDSLGRTGLAGALSQPRNDKSDNRIPRRNYGRLAQFKVRSARHNPHVPVEKPRLQHDTFHVGAERDTARHNRGSRP